MELTQMLAEGAEPDWRELAAIACEELGKTSIDYYNYASFAAAIRALPLSAIPPDAQAQIDMLQAELAKRDARIEALEKHFDEMFSIVDSNRLRIGWQAGSPNDKAYRSARKFHAAIAQEQS